MKKVLLDSDPGIDDALAILLALGSAKKIDVKAIVATFGNVGLSQTKKNLLTILGFFDTSTSLSVNDECGRIINKVPLIGSGSRGPLSGKTKEARYVHGEDGLAGLSSLSLEKKEKRVFKKGIDLIINLALSKKIDTIIATGPLTDLARAIKKAPTFLKNLDELVIMGGAVFAKGNVTPYSEFNFNCDPEAAKIVLNAEVNKTLVSLDVTQKTLLIDKYLKVLKGVNTPLAQFIEHLAKYAIWVNVKHRGFSGAPMHDPLAVGLAIDEKIGRYEDLCLEVVTKGHEKGKVFVRGGKPNVRFCKKVDKERFFKLFLETLTELIKRIKKG